MHPSNLLFNSTGSALHHIRGYPLYVCVWQRDGLCNVSSCQLCVPPATRRERTCEEVVTLRCQVGLWEDEGELAESARLISLYTSPLRDLQTSFWEAVMEELRAAQSDYNLLCLSLGEEHFYVYMPQCYHKNKPHTHHI